MGDDKIHYNWCMVDIVGIMQQGGYQILPPAPLSHGINYLPPRAMDGIPSPDSNFVQPEDTEMARKAFRQMLEEDFIKQSTASRWWDYRMMWCGPAGIGDAQTPDEYVQHFLRPLHAAFSGVKLNFGSLDCEGKYCGALFYLEGKHSGAWLGQPATGRHVAIKFGMHVRFDLSLEVSGCGQCGRIADAWLQIDIPGAFAQMGIDLLGRAKLQHMQAHESKEHAQMLAVLPPIEEGPGQEQMPAVVPAINKQDVPGAHAAVLLCCLLGILVASTSCWRFRSTLRGVIMKEPLLS